MMALSLAPAIFVLVGASLSAGLGWLGLLLLRYQSWWPIAAGILFRAGAFALVRAARAACVWLALRYLLDAPVEPVPILLAVALGCTPLLLAFLHFIPHFGWLVLGLLEIISFFRTAALLEVATGRSTGAVMFTLAASWLLVWIVARSLFEAGGRRASARQPERHARRLSMEEVVFALPQDAAAGPNAAP